MGDDLRVQLEPTTEADLTTGYKDTEFGLLPEEWEVTLLGEAITVHDSKRIPLNSTQRAQMSGPYPYYGANGVVDHINDFIFEGQHVLVAEDGGYWGPYEPSAYVAGGQFWVNNHAHIIKALPEKADNHYLMYLLRFMDLSGFISGTTRGKLNQGVLKKIPVVLPPLSEQLTIAHVLRTVQEAIEATENVIEATRELKRSLMSHLFTYAHVPVDEADQVPLKETEIGPVPEHWGVEALGQMVTRKITDGTHKTPQYTTTGIPFITAKDIRGGTIDLAECKFISPEEHERLASRCNPEMGDVLLSKVGTLGLVAKVDDDLEFSIFVQLALIKPDKSKVLPDYLRFALLSPRVQSAIVRASSQSTMKYIGVGKIANLVIPVPPLPEQDQVAHILRALEEKIAAEENRRQTLDVLFKTLLHSLMTGKVRVDDLDFSEVLGVV